MSLVNDICKQVLLLQQALSGTKKTSPVWKLVRSTNDADAKDAVNDLVSLLENAAREIRDLYQVKVFHVFHHRNPSFGISPEKEFSMENYECVALVRATTLDEAFSLTNSIDQIWWKNPEITCFKPCRDFSVGDLMIVDGEIYLCQPCGWKLL